MKISSTMTFAMLAVAVALFGNGVQAMPVRTCEEQLPCFTFTKTLVAEGSTMCAEVGGCTWQVCLVIDLDRDGCQKSSSDTLSHVCDRADAGGCLRSPLDFDDDGSGTCPVGQFSDDKCAAPTGFTMCQYGSSGDTLYFLLKDGNNRSDETNQYTSSAAPFVDADSSCDSLSCFNGNDDFNCGGGAVAERVWAYTLNESCSTCEMNTAPPTVAPVPDTDEPTIAPTVTPVPDTDAPTIAPTVAPVPDTDAPTSSPTVAPVPDTDAPTSSPTVAPVPDTDSPTPDSDVDLSMSLGMGGGMVWPAAGEGGPFVRNRRFLHRND